VSVERPTVDRRTSATKRGAWPVPRVYRHICVRCDTCGARQITERTFVTPFVGEFRIICHRCEAPLLVRVEKRP
jgi:hypothetical protein